MNVVDLPQPANHALYDSAITRYARLVRARSVAVYRVGHVCYPGLSDVSLLVVINRTGIDNRFYFSALARLPARYHRLFLQEPFILPAWSLRVMQYTTHDSPVLLAGRDVLHAYAPNASADEQWCRMLEGYCSYAALVVRTWESGTLKGRQTVAAASAFRHVLADAGALIGTFDARSYGTQVDSLRAGFFERQDPAAGVLQAWQLLESNFEALDTRMQKALRVNNTGAAIDKARALLRGEESCEAFDRDYAFQRDRDIDGYHQELASLGFPYGHLFYVAAHPGAVRRLPTPAVAHLVHNLYRVRRRLSDYAARA